jgi:ParB family chromosome partitioning protein
MGGREMSRREELMSKTANIRAAADIPQAEKDAVAQNYKPRSGQGAFAHRMRLEDRVKELEAMVGVGSEIPVANISPNPWQPRRVFDPKKIEELTSSISEVGLIQPIIVRSVGSADTSATEAKGVGSTDIKYQIVAGERRLRAHLSLGKSGIKAVVIEVTDEDMAALALAENMDRENLTAYEIAIAIKKAEAAFPSRKSLAAALGINRTDLYSFLAFHKLPDFMITDLEVAPGIIGREAAEDIVAVLGNHGEQALCILKSLWPRVKEKEVDQGKVASIIVAALNNKTSVKTERDIKKLFVGKEQVGSITRDAASFTVKIRVAALTPDMEVSLRQCIENLFSNERS